MGGNSYFIFFPIMTRCSLKLYNILLNCDREMPIPPSFRIFLVDYVTSKNFQNRPTGSRDINRNMFVTWNLVAVKSPFTTIYEQVSMMHD